jgi:hypothetical protein
VKPDVGAAAHAAPSFARRTGQPCQCCHTVFPELTPYGRRFKLGGYTQSVVPQIKAGEEAGENLLSLNQLAPLSAMLVASFTRTQRALPDITLPDATSQNGQVLFPQEASLFYAGRITPNVGAFLQLTYESGSGSVGLDNSDLRFATPLDDRTLVIGASLNNNPTVQDVWNTTPAWQVPFNMSSASAPVPAAATQIDQVLAQNVAGLSVYAFWLDSFYAELGGYRSAPQGFENPNNGQPGPLNSAASNVVDGVAPYWRLAYERNWAQESLMVGAYGLQTRQLPGNGVSLSGPTDNFSDIAVDAQFQHIAEKHVVSLQATHIRERQQRDASLALGTSSSSSLDLHTTRLGASYYYRRRYGAALGYFDTSGTADPMLYAANPVFGSASGSPDSRGWRAELDYLPWQNVKIGLQYTAYTRFNGGTTNYDGFGRNASDNNTLYLFAWLAF